MNVGILTDENIPSSLIKELRKNNFNVKDLKEEKLFSLPDIFINDMAKKENRIVITYDKDFLNISSNPRGRGIILIKTKDQKNKLIYNSLISLLKDKSENLINSLCIITDTYTKIIKEK